MENDNEIISTIKDKVKLQKWNEVIYSCAESDVKEYTYGFLKYLDFLVDNIRAENGYTIGRETGYSNTLTGINTSDVGYPVITITYANGLNIEQYLSNLFSKPAVTIIFPGNEK